LATFALATLAPAGLHSRSQRLKSCRQFLQIKRAVLVLVVLVNQHFGKLSWFGAATLAFPAATFPFTSTAFAFSPTFALSFASGRLSQGDGRHGGNRGGRSASGEQFANKTTTTLVNTLKRRIYGFWKFVVHQELLADVKE